MRLIPIRVESCAGAEADETPRRLKLEEGLIEVAEVLNRRYQVGRRRRASACLFG
jgi:hypothetical protein